MIHKAMMGMKSENEMMKTMKNKIEMNMKNGHDHGEQNDNKRVN